MSDIDDLADALPAAHQLQAEVERTCRELEAAAAAYSRGGEDADLGLHQAAIAFAAAVSAMDEWLAAGVH